MASSKQARSAIVVVHQVVQGIHAATPRHVNLPVALSATTPMTHVARVVNSHPRVKSVDHPSTSHVILKKHVPETHQLVLLMLQHQMGRVVAMDWHVRLARVLRAIYSVNKL